MIKQSQRVLYFRFFGTMRLLKIVIFRLKLGFLSIYLPIIFPKLGRNAISEFLTLYPNYIPFYQGGGGGSKSAPIWASTLYWKFETLQPATNWIFKKPQRVPPFTISKSLSFLSLRYGADFRRSRLVSSYNCSACVTSPTRMEYLD